MKRPFLFIFVMAFVILTQGCSITKYDDTKINDLDFTILKESDIPPQVMDIVEKSKETNSRQSYLDSENLYIIICYGAQPTTNYSISIQEIYEAEKAIFISSMLMGPSKKEKVIETETYPYIVIRLDYNEKTVIFR